jgi:tRNA pseudouridine32 synthase / 23S rRNA pseudouridine746 synthase
MRAGGWREPSGWMSKAESSRAASAAQSLASASLPLRDGVSASTRVLPPLKALDFLPVNLLSFLEHPTQNPQGLDWENRLEMGWVCDAQGRSLALDAPYLPTQRIYYWRDAGAEQRVPFDERIIYQDAHLLIADKPHFLPVTPTGRYVQETLLVRLKKRTGLADLTPIHRIDRDTAGLVMFCIQVQDRDAYAGLFRERKVDKTYECIAPYTQALAFPLSRKTRLVESTQSFMQMAEAPGQANSETWIECLGQLAAPATHLARYRLKPITGKRHQLRVHMHALGLPILGDGIYPELTPESQHINYAQPLQLLAQRLAFTDPVTGQAHEWCSQLRLGAWAGGGALGG